jgi:hypothetical protein
MAHGWVAYGVLNQQRVCVVGVHLGHDAQSGLPKVSHVCVDTGSVRACGVPLWAHVTSVMQGLQSGVTGQYHAWIALLSHGVSFKAGIPVRSCMCGRAMGD